MGERKKPSSIRGRVERARKGYSKPMNPVPIIIGVVVVGVCGVGLFLAFKGEPASDAGEGGTGETPAAQAAAPASAGSVSRPRTPAPTPKEPKNAVYALTMRAKRDAKTAPDAALRVVEQALGKYPDYTPDMYHAMAMIVETKIQKSGGSSAPRELFREKLKYLRRAKVEIDAGKGWILDQRGSRTGNLDMSIKQAEMEANK